MTARCHARAIGRAACAALTTALLLSAAQPAAAQPGWVLSHQKISSTEGGFTGVLDNSNSFGSSVASLGDLDGDGVADLAVGAPYDDGQSGAVWVLFLDVDGTVKSYQKISNTEGGFTGVLDGGDWFGESLASLGDLDGDGVGDLAVGAYGDSGRSRDEGAVWVLFLNTDGTVRGHQKIGAEAGGFTGILTIDDAFGFSVASLGDFDGDGVADLAVGAIGDDDGGGGSNANRGAVWVLFLNTDGTVRSHQKVSDTEGGFTGVISNDDWFGWSVASLGDRDGDGVADLAVEAINDRATNYPIGAVWLLFLNNDGTVKSHQRIGFHQGGFNGELTNSDYFGSSLASLGDLDGDGVGDLAVGAMGDDDGGGNYGAEWILFLNSDSTVKSYQKISSTEGGFTGTLDIFDWFGYSAVSLGDLNGDGVADLAVGASYDDDGGTDRGAVYVLFLDGVPCDPCDTNCDGNVDAFDIEPFIDLLLGPGQPCAPCAGDANGDGVIDAFDIEPFINCLVGP